MGKTLEDLRKSREVRQQFIQKYGEVLTSVWDIDYSQNKYIQEISNFLGANERLRNYYQHEDVKLQKAFSSSGSGVRGKGAGLSKFPLDLARRLLLFYSEEGNKVFDPCMGHIFSSRLYATFRLKRKYIGYDICKEFYEQNEMLIEYLLGNIGQGELFVEEENKPEIYNRSSEKVHLENESIDFIFTSTPYWDLEFYDDNPQQYGYKKTYEQFLSGIATMLNECYRILKKGKYFVVNINDFRKEGTFYDYHSDVIRISKKANFKLHDIIIIKWASSLQSCFASQLEERKMTAKIHEYVVVFKKE